MGVSELFENETVKSTASDIMELTEPSNKDKGKGSMEYVAIFWVFTSFSSRKQ
jgi:hypothetical protein